MRPRLSIAVFPLAVSLATLSSIASAQRAPVARPPHNESGDGYAYQFDDDPLQAITSDPVGARIGVAMHSMRVTLIRPRTAFVVEMYKSVEKL